MNACSTVEAVEGVSGVSHQHSVDVRGVVHIHCGVNGGLNAAVLACAKSVATCCFLNIISND